ncbi:MAG: transmembrane anchor protein [Bermanella sp.]
MYNANIPKDNELPSTKQLIKSTIAALVVALILLATVILPAEYGVDPTGLGKTLGLTQMGEIKSQLAHEAKQENSMQVSKAIPQETKEIEQTSVIETDRVSEIEPMDIKPSDTRSFKLKPGQAAEIKLGMNKGGVVAYDWSVNKGHVNYDVHGDTKGVDYFGYSKGKSVTQDSGELKAAFDGKHGWFWRNRSDQVVTVTLVVSGDYRGVYRVL